MWPFGSKSHKMEIKMSDSALKEALLWTAKDKWKREALSDKFGDSAAEKVEISINLDEDEIPDGYNQQDICELEDRIGIVLWDILNLIKAD